MWIHLYTAWTPSAAVETTLASSWGLLINIDSATGGIARTTDWWVEDEKFWIRYATSAATSTIKFSSTTPKTWRLTIQFDCSVNAASFPQFRNSWVGATPAATWPVDAMTKYGIPIKPSTKYRIFLPIETINTGWLWAYLAYVWYSSSGNRFTNLVQYIAWTFNGIKVYEFTSNASDAYLHWVIGYNSGCTGTMNVDYNNFRIEEVIEPVANSLTSSSPSLVSFTAVGSTDNIDVSQLTNTASLSLVTSFQYTSQQFTPTKSKFAWVTFNKKASTGSPTCDVVFKIVNDNANNPWTTVYASYTMTSAVYNALTVWNDFTVNLPCNLAIGVNYWISVNATVASVTNYIALGWVSPWVYSWLWKYWTDWITYWSTFNWDYYFKTLYYKPTTNFKASQNNETLSISADEDGFLNWSILNLVTWTATFTETFGTFYLLQYTISWSDLIAKIQLPWVWLSASFTCDKTLEYSSDWITYGATFPTGFSKVWVKILAYSGFANFSYSIQFSTSGINVLKNYPTNKDIIKQYSTTLWSATTSATYRATKWGFPAIEYSATEYQYLDVDTTATGSTVAFSELGVSFTTVADGASLTISSASNPVIWVKANITANRLYLSSNDYNAISDKDGSNKQSVIYQVKPNPQIAPGNMNSNIKLFYG